MCPIAVLGLLFMRNELLGHRHHDEREALDDREAPHRRETFHEEVVDEVRIHHGAGVPTRLPGRTAASAAVLNARTEQVHLGHDKNDPDFVPASVGLREAHHHEPKTGGFLSGAKHVTDLVLKVEIIAVVVVAVVLFGVWAEGQRREFVRTTNYNVCEMSFGC